MRSLEVQNAFAHADWAERNWGPKAGLLYLDLAEAWIEGTEEKIKQAQEACIQEESKGRRMTK